MATTGQLIRAARAAMGFTQSRLAAELRLHGVTNATVSAWERGAGTPPTESSLAALALVLRTTVENLTGDGLPDPAVPTNRVGRPPLAPEDQKHNYKSPLTLNGPIPEWIGYEDLKALVRQFRGRFYDERSFKIWVEVGHPVFGKCPSRIDGLAIGTAWPGVRRRNYHWPEVKAWIQSTLYIPDEMPTTGGAHAARQ